MAHGLKHCLEKEKRNQNRVALWFGLVALFFGLPLASFAQTPPLQYVSNFQFELAPGEGADDGLAIINDSGEQKTVVVYSADAIGFQQSGFSYSNRGERDKLASWVRFFSPSIPDGPQEVRGALTGIESPRYLELCQALNFGKLEKREREQKVVRALNRNLSPLEIQYLQSLTNWCVGSEEMEFSLGPGETIRVPFMVMIPNQAVPREYHAGLFVEFSDGRRELVARVQQTTPGSRGGRIELVTTRVSEEGSGRVQVGLVFANTGDRTVRGEVGAVFESGFPEGKRTVLVHSATLAPGGTGSVEFFGTKPLFGSFQVQAYSGAEEQAKRIYSTFIVPWFPLFILIIFVVAIASFIIQRLYWKGVWLATLRQSWSLVECEELTKLPRLARLYGIPQSLLALLNNVRTDYEFRAGDRVLLPPSHLIVQSRKGRNKGKKKSA